jgi:hypothetical protein
MLLPSALALLFPSIAPPPIAVPSIAVPSAVSSAVSSIGPAPSVEEPRDASADEPSVLTRVVAVGASLTAGAGVSPDDRERSLLEAGVPLVDVLAAASTCEACAFQSFHNAFFFTAPMKTGPQLLEKALARDPTLVVALDFLFWFGYGAGDREGLPIRSEEQRLRLLEEGLVLLERVECTLIVGDFPDMSPAVGKMIAPAQMPRPETLTALNEMVHGWAAQRPNVVLVSLADAVTKMRSNEAFTLGGREWPAGSAAGLMQKDELHPTLAGAIAVVEIAVHELAARDLVREIPQALEGIWNHGWSSEEWF